MTPEQAFALLEQEPWKTVLEAYKRHLAGEGPMPEFLVSPKRSGKSTFLRAMAAWRAVHRPQDGHIRPPYQCECHQSGWCYIVEHPSLSVPVSFGSHAAALTALTNLRKGLPMDSRRKQIRLQARARKNRRGWR